MKSVKSMETSQDTKRENDELDDDIFTNDSHSEADYTEITLTATMISKPNTVLHLVISAHN